MTKCKLTLIYAFYNWKYTDSLGLINCQSLFFFDNRDNTNAIFKSFLNALKSHIVC